MLRKEASVNGALISHEPVQIEIASKVGLDVHAFMSHLEDGSAARAFEKDLLKTRRSRVSGFPTVQITYGSESLMLGGYRLFEDFKNAIEYITQGKIKPRSIEKTEESILTFMEDHPSMAIKEIQLAFGFNSIQEAERLVNPLVEGGKLIKEEAEYSYLVHLG